MTERTIRFDPATSLLMLEDGGALVAKMEMLVNAPHEVIVFHPRGPDAADPVGAATALVEEAVGRARAIGVRRIEMIVEDRFPHADAFIAAAPGWGFALDVVKVLVRAKKKDELRFDGIPDVPPGGEFRSRDAELPAVFQRVLASSITVSDQQTDANAKLLENEAYCRSMACFHPEDWVVLRVDGVPVGLVLPAFADPNRVPATNMYVGTVPEARGRGYGAMLVRHGIETMLARGATRYIGSTDVRNLAMRRIFERIGCRPVSTQHVFVRALP